MSATNKEFPWMSYYKNYNRALRTIRTHDKVLDVKEIDASKGLFNIVQQNRILRTFICECYCFCIADYEEALDHFDNLDAVIVNSTWCNYTDAVKEYCKKNKVGVFNISEFFGAINYPDYWNYISPDEK